MLDVPIEIEREESGGGMSMQTTSGEEDS